MKKDKQKKKKKDIYVEIVGITTCGTYPCWIDYTIASFYNHIDKIVVVNAGYDIDYPEKGAIIPLEREHKLIQDIDINHKIIEINPNKEQIDKIFKTTCNPKKDEFGRSTNMTLATQIASRLSDLSNLQNSIIIRYILKLDSDQILYQITREQLINLVYSYPSEALRFAQYADYLHDFEHINGILPDEFTNDGALFYKSLPDQGYSGQGSPGHLRINNQRPIYEIKTSHMRRISPPGVDHYEYHYKRLWYHTFGPNSIMEHEYNRKTGQRLTNEQIKEIARKDTISILQDKGIEINTSTQDERIPYKPPLVCQMTPLEYIKKGC